MGACWEPSCCEACPNLGLSPDLGFGRRLQDHRFVDSRLSFVASSEENKVKPLWRWLDFVAPHLSNVDVLPLKRKELREYILVSPLWLSLTLPLLLVIVSLCACLSYRIVT
jgi:hypothetical protein